nr:hypothetical protein [uncultured Roseovarius sp.]
MKAIPTRYAGVNFRSRLEARWAAFFDAANLTWDYEPIDLEGWAPDFGLSVASVYVLAEVKPVPLVKDPDTFARLLPSSPDYLKAEKHSKANWVLELGQRPQTHADYYGIGRLMDPPTGSSERWIDVHDALSIENADVLWLDATNKAQWRGQANG